MEDPAANNKDPKNKGKKGNGKSQFSNPLSLSSSLHRAHPHPHPLPPTSPRTISKANLIGLSNHDKRQIHKESTHIHTYTQHHTYQSVSQPQTTNPLISTSKKRRKNDVENNPPIYAVFVLLLFLRLRGNQRDLV